MRPEHHAHIIAARIKTNAIQATAVTALSSQSNAEENCSGVGALDGGVGELVGDSVVGRFVGLCDGRTVGDLDGLLDGERVGGVGDLDGLFDGERVGSVGLRDGDLDGLREGERDGDLEGLLLGESEGDLDGLLLGDREGDLEGDLDGAVVGFLVGAGVEACTSTNRDNSTNAASTKR